MFYTVMSASRIQLAIIMVYSYTLIQMYGILSIIFEVFFLLR